jgi:predicted CXXCH cytochrome family protein
MAHIGKLGKNLLVFLSSWMLSMAMFSNAWSAHADLQCAACHRLTEGENGIPTVVTNDPTLSESQLCLACHDAAFDVSGLNPPHVSNGPQDLAAGSFTPTTFSDENGHNIQSIDQSNGLTPPGGAPLSEFGCVSCHDAHDNGNYRNLKKRINGRSTIVEAAGDPLYQNNVYISGMSDFCGACHERFISAGNSRGARGWRQHPVGITIAGAQHADFNHWSALSDRVTLVEQPSGNSADLHGAQLFCLSCHRAHASSYKDALRWDYNQNTRGCLECHPF